MAPEEYTEDREAGILYSTKLIRQNAGRSEEYLIRLSSEQLNNAEIPIPSDLIDDVAEPTSVIYKMTQAIERQERIGQEIQKIASKKVNAARERTKKITTELEASLIRRLTNVSPLQAEKLNYVMPGESVEKTAWDTINKSIDSVINQQSPNTGYIIIPDSVLQHFKVNDEFRDDITANEIEPFLFGSKDNEQRASFLIREDPLALMCQSQALPKHLEGGSTNEDENTDDTDVTVSGDDNITENQNNQATPENVPEYIARLMDGMTSPEETVAFGVRHRANQDDVQEDISAFELRSGPADVPAFYDFHSLQIAFDYVWQHAIDEEVVEVSSELYNQILDMGGNPSSSLQNSTDPIKELRKEVTAIRRAYSSDEHITLMQKENLPDSSNGATPSGRLGSINSIASVDDFPTKSAPDSDYHDATRIRQPHPLLDYLDELLNERYSFTIFAAGSTNFGLLTTYRQKWNPVNYQVGDLIKTIPLTPGEERKITSKVVVKQKRNIKEMEASLRINKNESTDTSRAEAEIVRKAEAKTNFSISAKGAYNSGAWSGEVKTNVGKDAKTSSQETKKMFREAVIKAAQEYKDERKVDIDSTESFMDEEIGSTTIKNTNDELSVTYLFYELQRRFRVSEKIHRLTPVVLVGMEVPNPSRKAIDSLLLTHGWIIKRVLLDDTYRSPLMYISTRMVGEEVALREMKKTLDELRSLVEGLKEQQIEIHSQVGQRYTALERSIKKRIDTISGEETEGVTERISEWWGGSSDDESEEAAQMSEEAAKEAYEKAAQEEKQMRARLETEVTALNSATQTYTKEYAEYLNRRLEIGRLRIHIKQNILYYMQAIWSTTYKDQIFFDLHKIKVPTINSTNKTYTVSEPSQVPANVITGIDETVLEISTNVTLDSNLDPEQDYKTLEEIADLDNPVGFKGNYMIFPLKESNPLIDYMMTPYVDSELGLHDPDDLGNWTPSEFAEYVACLKESLEKPQFDLLRNQLVEQYKRLISAPRLAEEEIIVPGNGSLYIEALVGKHSLIEDFKLLHRKIDVKKVQAEVRSDELENIRMAARLLAGERDDPDVDKKVVVHGDSSVIVGDE